MAGGMQRRSAVLLLRLSAPLCLLAGLRHNYDVEGAGLHINVGPDIPIEGKRMLLLCLGTVQRTEIFDTWTKDGEQLATSARVHIRDAAVRVDRALLSDSGVYSCFGKHNGKRLNATVNVRVTALPRVKKSVTNVTAWILQQVYLNCSGDHFQAAKWMKDGLRLISSKRVNVTTNPGEALLKIASLAKSDEGTYRCEVTNELNNATASMTFWLTVVGSLSFGAVTPPQTVFVGARVELKCNASGFPTPRLHWRRIVTGGCAAYTKGKETLESQADGNYVIKEASRETMGEFQCLANNTVLTDETSSSVSVIVDNQTTVAFRQSTLQGHPEIIRCPDRTPTTNSSVIWITDKKILNVADGSRHSISANGSLVVQEALQNDSGRYQCVLQDVDCPFLFVSSGVILWTVGAYPGAPLDLSVSRVSDSHLLVRWKPPADDGGDHIRSYVLMLRNSRLIWRQTLPGSNLIAVVTVSNLSHDSNYLVSVLAQNTFGQSVTVDTLYRYSEPAPRPSNSSRVNTPPSVGMTMSPVVPSMTSPAVTRQGDGDDLIQIVHVALSAGAFCLVCIISVYAILHYRKNRRHNTVGRRNRNSREWISTTSSPTAAQSERVRTSPTAHSETLL